MLHNRKHNKTYFSFIIGSINDLICNVANFSAIPLTGTLNYSFSVSFIMFSGWGIFFLLITSPHIFCFCFTDDHTFRLSTNSSLWWPWLITLKTIFSSFTYYKWRATLISDSVVDQYHLLPDQDRIDVSWSIPLYKRLLLT